MAAFQDLETEYTPSLFSTRFQNRDQLLENHIKCSTEESNKARENYDCHLNIAYGCSFRQKLDIYGDDLKADAPLFVFIHGGYWQGMDKGSSAYVVAPLVQQGIRVIIIDYELCPRVTLLQIVMQVQKAFKWIGNYIKENGIKNVSFAGHSAGAHLLACSLTEEFIELVGAVKLSAYFISGIYDLEELRHLKAANENNILSLDEGNVRELSPQFHEFAHLKNVDIFVFVGDCESGKFKQQSKNFAEGPLKTFSSVRLEFIKERDHFDMVEKLSESDYKLTILITENALN